MAACIGLASWRIIFLNTAQILIMPSDKQASLEVISSGSENRVSLERISSLSIGSGTEANLHIGDSLLEPVRFFGPADEFLMEAEDTQSLLRFTRGENGVDCATVRLGDIDTAGA